MSFAAHTVVTLAGFNAKPISEVRCGELVLGYDTDGNIQPVRVLKTESMWNAKVVSLSDGTICTPDQMFMSDSFKFVMESHEGMRAEGSMASFKIVSEPTNQIVFRLSTELTAYIANGWRVK